MCGKVSREYGKITQKKTPAWAGPMLASKGGRGIVCVDTVFDS